MEEKTIILPLDKNNSNQRKSNFELLRIIAMLMILYVHCIYYGFIFYPQISDNINQLKGINYYFFYFFKAFGQVGVTLFVLISSYFLCTKKFNIKSYLKLIFENVFYIITIHLSTALIKHFYLGTETISLHTIIELIPKISSIHISNNWFIAVYLTIYLIFPFLNIIVNRTTKMQHLFIITTLVSSLFVLSSLHETIIPDNNVITNLIWWISIYFTASYVKLHPEDFSSKRLPFIGIILCLIIRFIDIETPYYEARNNYFVFFLALFIFLLFKNLEIKNSKIINIGASTTLGVYMMHDTLFFWQDILKFHTHIDSKFLWVIITLSVPMIFLVLGLIDLIRQYLIEKPIFKFLTNKFNDQFNKINNFFPYENNSAEKDSSNTHLFWELFYMIFISASLSHIIHFDYDYMIFMILLFILIFAYYYLKRTVKLKQNNQH